MDGLIGGVIFGFIGAFIKWVYLCIKGLFTGKEYKPLSEIYAGKKDDSDYDVIASSMSNQAVGIIFIMLIVCLILYLNL